MKSFALLVLFLNFACSFAFEDEINPAELELWKLRPARKNQKREYIIPVKSKSACELPLGLEDKRIPDESITASSFDPDPKSPPYLARLNTVAVKDKHPGSWVAEKSDANQWLQVDLGKNAYVTKVGIQGGDALSIWVKTFTLSYSIDGVHWVESKQDSVVKVFPGNHDKYTEVVNNITPPVACRFIRIHPKTWNGHIGIRAELYGCLNVHECALPLGVEDGRIPDHAMSASSEYNANIAAHQGRINFQGGGGKHGSWAAKTNDKNQWLQIDFGHVTGVTRVAIQGRYDADQWVERYRLSYSSDGDHYATVMENSHPKDFAGNTDRNTIIIHSLSERLDARYLRFHPQTWKGHICMRVEVYGCKRVHSCLSALGLEDGRIPDASITASSSYSNAFLPPRGRLNIGSAGGEGSWAAKDTKAPWIQVDFGKVMRVTGAATQGRYNADQWVTSYWVSYSYNGENWVDFKEQSQVKIFQANSDRNTIARNVFYPVLFARVVRINIKTFNGHPSMRFELYGCQPSYYCSGPLGTEDGRIPNGAFSASTYAGANHPPQNARLNLNDGGGKCGCWAAGKNDANQYLQINLGHPTTVTKIGTQGRGSAVYLQWVSSYTVQYSVDGYHWMTYYLSDGGVKIFGGNVDSNTLVIHHLENPIHASQVRIRPRSWNGHISMRAELYGCTEGNACLLPLGMEDHRIPSSSLSASTNYANLEADRGRLNLVKGGDKGGAWCVTKNDGNQYYQIDLLHPTLVTKVAIQGRQDHPQWVRSYSLSYSFDSYNWIKYKGGSYSVQKIFPGTFDQNSIITSHIYPPIYARYVRIEPKTWQAHICLRTELYGCSVKGHAPPWATIAV